VRGTGDESRSIALLHGVPRDVVLLAHGVEMEMYEARAQVWEEFAITGVWWSMTSPG
jgi:hypothetical protein